METRENRKFVSKTMKPNLVLVVFTATFLLLSFSVQLPYAAPPIIDRRMEIVEATIEGNAPSTVDPAFCYDTASGELLMNCYDTLVFIDGENLSQYLAQLATEWTIVQHSLPIHDPETGLNWYHTYYFRIRTGVQWHNPAFGTVTPGDVEYCFERGMVMDPDGGPQWMYYEPLLNGASHNFINGIAYDPLGVSADAIYVGKCIDHAVESNSTHVWFNLAFPGAYPSFLQTLCSPSSSIYSKAWANSLDPERANWDGTWADYTGWAAYCNPEFAPFDALAPFDDAPPPDPVLMGSGPFMLANIEPVLMYWDVNRFANYWRGWGSGPAPNYGIGWPAFVPADSKTAGYVDHYKVTWAYDWTTRKTMFLNSEVDYCDVPTMYESDILGKPNIRNIYFPVLNLNHFESTWIVDWYYNPLYKGNYVANTWKWYYDPQAENDDVTDIYSILRPCDINYDGIVNMKDIGTVSSRFMEKYGPPMTPKWIFRCDIVPDGVIDMKDIGRAASRFMKTSAEWQP